MGTGQRRMPAQINLTDGRKPTNLILTTTPPNKRCFGQVIFSRDCLHQRVGERLVNDTDCSGIPREERIGKRVNLIPLDLHRARSPYH